MTVRLRAITFDCADHDRLMQFWSEVTGWREDPDDPDEEVERLLHLGATVAGDHRLPDGRGWVTLADPEGNEFCVERSDAERAGG